MQAREVDLTSYSEIVLAPQLSDMAHPAFSKLFVRTEYLANEGAILATRRRRTANEPEVWAAHLSVLDGEGIGKVEIETDRARFLGRGGSIRTAAAALDGRALSGTTGTVLDPIFALRRRVRVAPGETVRVAFWTIVARSRETLLDLVDKHRDITAFERASTLAWTQAQVQLRHIGITPGEAALFQRLAGHLVHATTALRPSSDSILRGAGSQSSLWSLGISGDLPIVLLRIADYENLDLVHQLLQAHEYWRMKLLAVDLVILNERASSYVQDLQIGIETLVRTSQARLASDVERTSGRVFVLRSDLMPVGHPGAVDLDLAGGAGRTARTPVRSTRSRAGYQNCAGAVDEAPLRTRQSRRRTTAHCLKTSSSSTDWVGFLTAVASMWQFLRRASRRRLRGSMSWPIRISDFRSGRRAAAARGPPTAGRTNSRPGRTIL